MSPWFRLWENVAVVLIRRFARLHYRRFMAEIGYCNRVRHTNQESDSPEVLSGARSARDCPASVGTLCRTAILPDSPYRSLRSACSIIRAQCWAKLSRESNVSGSEVTSAIFRQSHATSLYSSAAFIGIAKAFFARAPWHAHVTAWALPKFMSGRSLSRTGPNSHEAARCRRPLSFVAFWRSYGRASN